MSKRLREMRLSRALARAEKPAADAAEKFTQQAHDLDAARKTVEDAASVSGGLWLSYLFALFYIGIATGGVTHKDLLLENPVKLPFLNVELPLVAFFLFAPVLFIVSHAYTLLHFVMLAAKVGVFNKELYAQLDDAPETREGLRRQLPSNIFVQFLAGPSDIRKGGLGFLLKAIAWISLVIFPVLLLLLLQAQFLPYHLEWVTWVQRVAIVGDVILLWALWPAVLNGRSEIKWPRLWRHPVLTLVSLIPIGLAFTAATFPGEWLDEHVGKWPWIPPNRVTARLGIRQMDSKRQPVSTSFHDILFNGEVDPVTRRRKSLFSNTLVLPAFDALEAKTIDDQKKFDWVKHTLVLRGRHLEGAVFDRADLRKADLEGAYLEGASLDEARLQGAALNSARLERASLKSAQLQGASLDGAYLQGASLDEARLQGASLISAQLQGASLSSARLQGASLDSAQLGGATLSEALLQDARLNFAQLQGASLHKAWLQGADFYKSTLAATDLSEAVVWRTHFKGASLADVVEFGFEEKKISKDEFAALKADIMKWVPEGWGREDALKRIEKLNPDIFGPETSQDQMLEKKGADTVDYEQALAGKLKILVCSGDESAPYIVRGLIANNRIFDTGGQARSLVEAILDKKCPVFITLTEQDTAELKRWAELSAAHQKQAIIHQGAKSGWRQLKRRFIEAGVFVRPIRNIVCLGARFYDRRGGSEPPHRRGHLGSARLDTALAHSGACPVLRWA